MSILRCHQYLMLTPLPQICASLLPMHGRSVRVQYSSSWRSASALLAIFCAQELWCGRCITGNAGRPWATTSPVQALIPRQYHPVRPGDGGELRSLLDPSRTASARQLRQDRHCARAWAAWAPVRRGSISRGARGSTLSRTFVSLCDGLGARLRCTAETRGKCCANHIPHAPAPPTLQVEVAVLGTRDCPDACRQGFATLAAWL